MSSQWSHFREIENFLGYESISKTSDRGEMIRLSACSTFNSEQNDALLRYLGRTFFGVSHLGMEQYHLTGKVAEGKTGSMV